MTYCGLSILVTILNKHISTLFSEYNPIFLRLILQTLVSIRLSGWMNCSQVKHPVTSLGFKLRYMFITFLLIISVYSNIKALETIPVSLFNSFKNIGPVLVIIGDIILETGCVARNTFRTLIGQPMGKMYTQSSLVCCIFVVLLGWINYYIYSHTVNEYSVNAIGYMWTLINCIGCALHILYTKKYRILYPHITFHEHTRITNILALIPLGICFLYFDIHRINFNDYTAYNLILIFLSCGLTHLLTLVIALILTNLSATKYAVVVSLNKIPINLVSIYLFTNENTSLYYILSTVIISVCTAFFSAYNQI